jgi:hypothetical protein
MKLREAVFFSKVSIPHENDVVDVELAHQVAVDPPIREIHKIDVHFI